jgi:hypothetical protein
MSVAKVFGGLWIAAALLVAASLRGQDSNSVTYAFDDGLAPAGTTLWKTADSSGNQVNPGEGVTNVGGFQNTGMLILTVPGAPSVQTFAQWLLPDFAVGGLVTNLACSFNVFLGGPSAGGNGMLFHWGPGLKNQYSGSASSFGQGLDVTLRTYGSGVNPSGINVFYGGSNTPGNNTPVAANPFLGYYRGGVTNFASNTWFSFSVAVTTSGSQTNALFNLVCSNAWIGSTNIFSNVLLTNFVSPLANHTMAFTATDGGGMHEFCYLDNVDFTVNGAHIASIIVSNAVVLTGQPASLTVTEGQTATFSVAATGTSPLTYQWYSNGVAITGANAASYTTPSTFSAMNGTLYAVAVSNSFSGVLSTNAMLGVLPAVLNRLLLGSNLGAWGTNTDGTINDPFMNNSGIQSKAGAVIAWMRFPCRSFTSNQLHTIARSIRGAGIEPLAILTAKNQSNALAQITALSGLVTYFEFGNENNYADGWSGAAYATNWSNAIPLLRAAAPNAKFGGPVGSDYTRAGSTYLRDFLNAIRGNASLTPDFVSMHYYSGHGEVPAWSSSQILTDVDADMLPGIDTMQSDIASITETSLNLAITEWNYDAVPENNTNTLDTNAVFMHSYTYKVLDGFKAKGVWGSCQYDFASGAGGGHLDMVSTASVAKPQYNEFINWRNLNTNVPPTITIEPQSQTVPENVYARFGVAVTGTAPFSYQWMSNGVPIPGATGANYISPLTSLDLNGVIYAAAISNVIGGVLSSGATLTVARQISPAGLPIYTDHLVNGFQDWSYGTHSLAATSPVHSGSAAISMSSVTPGHNVSFYHPADTSPYASLSFWANGGSGGGQVLQVQALLSEVGQAKYQLPALAADTWQQFVIPLASLGADSKTNFDRILFQPVSGSTTNTFYLDDIQFVPALAPSLVHLSINASQPVRQVDARTFGINTAAWDGNLDTPQTVSLLQEIGATALRFPGGSTADTYHWTVSSVNHFARVATNIGAQAINTVNYGSGTPTEAAGWVRFCNATNSYAFRYWEIGNECYGTWETDYNTNAPYNAHDPWTYATLCASFIAQMKAADPSIKVGVAVIDGEDGWSNGYTNHPAFNPRTGETKYGWTPVLLNTLKSLGVTPDFVSFHFYPESGGDESDPLVLQSSFGSPWADRAANLRQQLSDYLGPAGTNVELLMTENNSDSGPQGRQSTSLVNALYYADSVCQLMLSEFNAFAWWDLRNSADTGGNMDSTLYGWRTNGDLGMVSGLTNRYPEFYAAKLMRCFASPGDTVLSASSDYLLLSAYAVRRASGAVALLVINKDAGLTLDGEVSFNGFTPAPGATLCTYGIPQDAAVEFGFGSPDLTTNRFSSSTSSFSYSFPPLSLTLFTLVPCSPLLAILAPAAQAGDKVAFQLQGQPGIYVVQTSTNLSAWTAVSTNVLGANALTITNTIVPGEASRFWRAVWQP